MRVLVFAHVPPPHHGQSYMIQLMLENLEKSNLAGSERLELFHVNARLSDGVDDIGVWRIGKLFRLGGYIAQAWWMRWRYSLDAFYYVPAPAKRSALYRDWLVLSLAASFFKIRIFHWHATGLGPWVKEGMSFGWWRRLESSITRRLLSRHDLSCVLNEWGRHDIEAFSPPRVAVVANGIPDPCPDFNSTLLPERLQRLSQRSLHSQTNPPLFRLLYLAHATRAKGLFDAIEAVAQANAKLAQNPGSPRIRLTVAGAFFSREEERAFQERINQNDLALKGQGKEESRAVVYAGHVAAAEKDRLLREADAVCFASYFPNEGQPVAVIEALAYGLPVLLSRWRALSEMISPALACLVDPADSSSLAEALPLLFLEGRFEEYRKYYLDHYTLITHCDRLRTALLSVAPAGMKGS